MLFQIPGIQVNTHTQKETYSGNIKKVILSLSLSLDEIDINTKNYNERSLLFLATYGGHLELVKMLLKQPGIQVNTHDFHGSNSPLHVAAYKNNLEIVQELLAFSGTEVNTEDRENQTPLHIAVEKENLEIVQELLKSPKTDLNIKDYKGRTSIDLAKNKTIKNVLRDHASILVKI